jgi:hypothetical protein
VSLPSVKDIPLNVSGSAIPPASPSARGGPNDTSSVYSAFSPSQSSAYQYGTLSPTALKKRPTIETIRSSAKGSILGGKTNDSGTIRSRRESGSSKPPATLKDEKPKLAHTIAFETFHNQRGVRTFVGSIGPIDNVRMMVNNGFCLCLEFSPPDAYICFLDQMKPGHRHCYMSREFAQKHAFIPKDAAPGFYGFSGITNLGSWPIKVGEKTVDQQVMLVENSYFPIILGR